MTHGAEATTPSTHLVRRLNAERVLQEVWDGEPVTASALMAATGLARSTVLALCRELTDRGWLVELDDARAAGAYTKGRPALRYAFRPDAALVVGVDAGQHRVSAAVADLHGRVVAEESVHLDPGSDAAARRASVLDAVGVAVARAGRTDREVVAAVLGVPAPVGTTGVPAGERNPFWALMNPGLEDLFADRGWDTVVENDANLAAVAEAEHGDGAAAYAALLVGERFGAGIVLDGTLRRGPRGAIGEMRILDLVEGVGRSDGLGALARDEARRRLDAGRAAGSVLADVPRDRLDAEHVLAAAGAGDAVAGEVVDGLADRLARVCAVLSGLLDLDRVIVTGAMAPALGPVVERARALLPDHLHDPSVEVVVSDLGPDVVRTGAVRLAVEHVRSRALDRDLPAEG
ncbi:ROK family transcriptional regulator [Krasilnikoviella flava]|uniref:Sugar kinase of the NBD/HSP70 family, may contain an N-terminal HTH domain n=1 Tax=Krasilnikoviella flava TaxID=526729 RepID=A0A1T5JXV8_9MICO|nr:ROK family protein [Krasilnikoviella flava]SKC56382.1 Sugar kinase of the NBD/HSP70 family, may contain an N-terminal HTH domain [Krasilnikoviella flava]